LRGLPFLESAERVLLIDAARGNHPPGSIYLIDSSETTVAAPMHSLHSMGLREALKMLSPHCRPPSITVIGVEPQTLDYGMDLSAPVRAALPQIVRLARGILLKWSRSEACAAVPEMGSEGELA
jgi:hydrogenase maturation protease